MSDLLNEQELEGLSAEELAELANEDDGSAELEQDHQHYTIDGIDELNDPPSNAEQLQEEEQPAEAEEDVPSEASSADESDSQTPDPVVDEENQEEVDYKEKYNQLLEQLAQKQLQSDNEQSDEETQEPEQDFYAQALDAVELSPDEQKKYDDFKEYDEDMAEMYQSQIKQDKLLQKMMANQHALISERTQEKEAERETQEQQYTDAINTSDNLKKWQRNKDTWSEVNTMYQRMMNDPNYSKLSAAEQMSKLEARYARFIGIEPKSSETPEPSVPDNKIAEKIEELEQEQVPSSLSSVSGGDPADNSGKIKLNDSVDGYDIQAMMDRAAESDDPEAIDKLLSSVDVA